MSKNTHLEFVYQMALFAHHFYQLFWPILLFLTNLWTEFGKEIPTFYTLISFLNLTQYLTQFQYFK